jgi:predicted GNAT family N-acyltransferase
MHPLIKQATSSADLVSCLDIRRKVFIEDQNVPEADEIDGLDGESDHYLLTLDNSPVGTTRVRYVQGKAKIERVAILSAYQGKGLGKKLMQYILQEIKNNGKAKKAFLGAQTYAIPFYENLGFSVCSDEYMDAGIPHKDMQMDVGDI